MTEQITYDQYLARVQGVMRKSRAYRHGQALFNVLAQVRPDLADQVRGSFRLDPFYVEGGGARIHHFLLWVKQNW